MVEAGRVVSCRPDGRVLPGWRSVPRLARPLRAFSGMSRTRNTMSFVFNAYAGAPDGLAGQELRAGGQGLPGAGMKGARGCR